MKKTLIAFAMSLVAGGAFAQTAPVAAPVAAPIAAHVTAPATATVSAVKVAQASPRHEMSKDEFNAHKEHILNGRELRQREAEKTTECLKGASNIEALHACFKAERDARPKLHDELREMHGPAGHFGHGPEGHGPQPKGPAPVSPAPAAPAK